MAFLGTMLGGAPKTKYTPVAAPAQPTTPTSADASIAAAGQDARARAAGGLDSTIRTSAQGAQASGAVAYKSLLGE